MQRKMKKQNRSSILTIGIFGTVIIFSLCGCLVGHAKGPARNVPFVYKNISNETAMVLDNYFKDNLQKHTDYLELKNRNPNLFLNVKEIENPYFMNFPSVYRFSNANNGSLNNLTLIKIQKTVIEIDNALGDFAVTKYLARVGDRGTWLFFMNTCISNDSSDKIEVFNVRDNDAQKYEIVDINLDPKKSYTINNSSYSQSDIDLNEAFIETQKDEENFECYVITQSQLIYKKIDDMKMELMETYPILYS